MMERSIRTKLLAERWLSDDSPWVGLRVKVILFVPGKSVGHCCGKTAARFAAAFRKLYCPMPILVSMLRGVNVGSHNRIKMDALRGLYESLHLEEPRTYLQSGNVIFRTQIRAQEKDLAQLAAKIQSAIEKTFACRPEVILRTVDELRNAMANSPFAKRTSRLKGLHQSFG